MSKDGAVVTATSAPTTLGGRIRAHFRRFWWVHLIVIVVVTLCISLPVVYVGYPRIAQSDINKSTLEVKSMSITEPTPDSFQLDQEQVIGSSSIFHPTIFAFDAQVKLAGTETPFATVQVPQIQANDGVEVHINQHVDLSSADAFGAFATAVMVNEEVNLNVYGEPQLKQGPLKTITVNYNKTATMKGLNKLSGFKLLEMKLTKEKPDGTNSEGEVLIPNPSVMTITMGNLTLDLAVDGTNIGQSFLNDLVLKPGDNKIAMTANVNQSALVPMLSKYEDKKYIVPCDITGNSSIYNGKHLPYFEKALAANVLKVDLNILDILGSS
ncbi:hypothetical protein FE257_001751 [Aspergillus nanangensis]|uniref:Uncharacterized protein n=1 Tax=Aspergillus nanangensis TaxID=2582783 RepID=A0AAD4CDF5_ASPNN|nr:hypothetical protein FE257_001751 [Aspergillus nanangensis]